MQEGAEVDVSGVDVMAIAHPAAVGNGDDEGPGNARGLETMATPHVAAATEHSAESRCGGIRPSACCSRAAAGVGTQAAAGGAGTLAVAVAEANGVD